MIKGPVTDRRFSRRASRQALLIGGGVLAAAALAVGGWFAYAKLAKSATESALAARQAEAQSIAKNVVDPINEISDKLVALGKSPEILALFEQRDAAGLAAAAQKHAADFPSALKLRLFLPGAYGLEPDAKPPLSFASLDLLGQAERSAGPIAVEAQLFGTPGQHIAVVRRAKNKADKLVGLLHLSLDVSLLDSVLSSVDVAGGYLELQQSAGGKMVVLAKAGQARGGQPIVVSVPNTRWSMAYTRAGGGAMGGGALAGNWLLIGGVVLIVIFASGAIVFWMQRPSVKIAGEDTVRKSGVVYAGAVKAIMEGAHPGMEQLVPNLPRFGLKRPVAPVSQGMTGDDITMIARKDSPKAAPKPAAKPAPGPAAKAAPKPAPKPAAGEAKSQASTDSPQKKSPQ